MVAGIEEKGKEKEGRMVKEDYKIFVGGLSWDISERQLERGFDRFGKIVESQYLDIYGDSGRPRGFGFITYADRRGMEDAIREMHGREFGDRIISVNKALPRGEEIDLPSYRGGYSSGGRGGSFARDGPIAQDECFKCGRLGHWARECPSAGGGRGGGGGPPLSSHSRHGGAGDRFGGEHDQYLDDHYDGARYGDGDRFDSRDMKYAGRDRYVNDRYPPAGDRFGTDRYGGSDRYPLNGFSKDRGYDRDPLPRGGGDRYGGGGPMRAEDRNYRSRAGPYDRPPRGVRGSSFERY